MHWATTRRWGDLKFLEIKRSRETMKLLQARSISTCLYVPSKRWLSPGQLHRCTASVDSNWWLPTNSDAQISGNDVVAGNNRHLCIDDVVDAKSMLFVITDVEPLAK